LPNLNVSILQGDTGIAKSPNNETANKIFKKLGNIYEVSESQLPILSAVLGSAPAFIAKIVEDLTNVAIANGMDSQIAEIATTHMTQATLEVINKEQITPNDFIRRVASPGGSTQRGLNSISNQIEIVLNAAIKKTIGLK
jgi:pyrroline-5-carboxylate reductase